MSDPPRPDRAVFLKRRAPVRLPAVPALPDPAAAVVAAAVAATAAAAAAAGAKKRCSADIAASPVKDSVSHDDSSGAGADGGARSHAVVSTTTCSTSAGTASASSYRLPPAKRKARVIPLSSFGKQPDPDKSDDLSQRFGAMSSPGGSGQPVRESIGRCCDSCGPCSQPRKRLELSPHGEHPKAEEAQSASLSAQLSEEAALFRAGGLVAGLVPDGMQQGVPAATRHTGKGSFVLFNSKKILLAKALLLVKRTQRGQRGLWSTSWAFPGQTEKGKKDMFHRLALRQVPEWNCHGILGCTRGDCCSQLQSSDVQELRRLFQARCEALGNKTTLVLYSFNRISSRHSTEQRRNGT